MIGVMVNVIFDKHPRGEYYLGKWNGLGDKKTDVPSANLFYDMFEEQPTMLIFDEFQTWYEGLTNSAKHKQKNWAFNFIQILIIERNKYLF